MFVKAFVLFLSLSLSLPATALPSNRRSAHHHAAIAARVASPVSDALNLPILPVKKRSASLRKRCRARGGSSSLPASGTPVANAGGNPEATTTEDATTKATTKAAPTTTKAATTEEPSSTHVVPTTTHKTTTKTTTADSPTTTAASGGDSSNLPSYLVGKQTGEGTYYATGLGSCGITNNDNDKIAAVSHLLYDSFPGYKSGNPNNNPVCGRKVKATYQGKSVTVTITDRCTGCAETDLDFSPSAFNELADFAVGRITGMTWVWL